MKVLLVGFVGFSGFGWFKSSFEVVFFDVFWVLVGNYGVKRGKPAIST